MKCFVSIKSGLDEMFLELGFYFPYVKLLIFVHWVTFPIVNHKTYMLNLFQ